VGVEGWAQAASPAKSDTTSRTMRIRFISTLLIHELKRV
jgi:hypothetical protein